MNMLGRISRKLQAELPSTSIDMLPPTLDQQFQNHQNFCDHVESYLTLRYAIQYADIGLLRHALRHTTVIFQASVAGTPKYAQALLYTLYAIDSSAATIRLQESILMNSLVNLRGDEESSFETDRLLEILNNNLKTFQHERSYFSKYSDTLLENWALNGPYLMKLKEIVEFYFGRVNTSKPEPEEGEYPEVSQYQVSIQAQPAGGIAYPIIEGGVVIATKSAEKYGDLSAEQKEDYKMEISAYKMKEKQVEKVAQGLRIVENALKSSARAYIPPNKIASSVREKVKILVQDISGQMTKS